MSAWRDHSGGACPTHGDATVRVRFRNGRESAEYAAKGLVWTYRGGDFDIVAFKVLSVPEEIAA